MSKFFIQRLKPSHLMLIQAIDETGKLHLAAQKAGISQPAASRLLSDIEVDIGGSLFDRHPRGMTATPLGAALVQHARVILSEIASLSEHIADLQGGHAGTVRVGCVTGPAVGAVLPAMIALRAEAGGIEPTIEVAPSTILLRGLEEGRFDFVIARLSADLGTRHLQAHPGRTEAVCLLVAATHPLANRQVSLADTLDYEFVIQEKGSPIRTAIEQAFLTHGMRTPDKVTNSSSVLIALSLVAETTAIAPQTREVARVLTRCNSNLAIIELDEDIIVSPYLVLYLAGHNMTPTARRLLDAVLRRL